MKVTLRANQIEDWQELASLIGAKHPADAVAYMGRRYLQLENSRLSQQGLPSSSEVSRDPPEFHQDSQKSAGNSARPAKTSLKPTEVQPPTAFDDLFDSIGT